MKKEYDFSNALQGKFYRPNKVQKTIRLDADVIEYFQNLSVQKKVDYQTLINQSLRNSIDHPEGMVDLGQLTAQLRKVIRSELKHIQAS